MVVVVIVVSLLLLLFFDKWRVVISELVLLHSCFQGGTLYTYVPLFSYIILISLTIPILCFFS